MNTTTTGSDLDVPDAPSDSYPLHAVKYRFGNSGTIHIGTARKDPASGMWLAADCPGGVAVPA